MHPKTLDQHIDVTPGLSGGKPRVAGHRITVQQIAVLHERLGKGADEIAAEYGLTLAEVHAALAYYFVHREEIDRPLLLAGPARGAAVGGGAGRVAGSAPGSQRPPWRT